ncbi:MAG: hypothetical protein ACKOHK_08830, partial [Planctomycetia bacterium]
MVLDRLPRGEPDRAVADLVAQIDRREQRKAKEGAKSVREISFMIRTCVPGGKLTADQLLAAIDLGDEVGNGTIRLTTRQSIQHHGVVKGDLKPFMQRVH